MRMCVMYSRRELPVTLAKRQDRRRENICCEGMAVRSNDGIYGWTQKSRHTKYVYRGFWMAIGNGNEDDEPY